MKNNKFSEDKLKDLLQNSNSAQAFKVPEGYFEDLAEKVMDSITALPDFEKQSLVQPFTVPANYFEDLPDIINNKIISLSVTKFSISKWLLNPARIIPATLSIIIFAGCYFYFTRTQTYNLNNDFITQEDLDDSQYLQSLNDNDMIEYLSNQSDEKLTDEYDQYLLDHDIDISQLEKTL